MVVPVPSDFSITNSRIGVEIYSTGAGTIKMYIDAVAFAN